MVESDSDVEISGMPDSARHCPKCLQVLKLARVSASPSPLYQAHTYCCPACQFSFTARVDL